MREVAPYIGWDAPEHNHIEKSSDWYWALGIVALTGSVVSIVLGNVLFGLVILLGATVVFLVSQKPPRIIPFEIGNQGVRIDMRLYPFSSIESYGIDHDSPEGPLLILKSKHIFMPLIIAPIPDDLAEEIDWTLRTRLPYEHLVEPFSHRFLEFLGF